MNNKEVENLTSGNSSFAESPQQFGVGKTTNPLPLTQPLNCDVASIVENDIAKIQKFVDEGKLDNTQGQYLVNYVINKALNMVNNQNQGEAQVLPPKNPFVEFEAENAGFFDIDGRAEVLQYLKNSGFDGDKDEISLISQIVENLENSAVQRYLKQTAHVKTLNDENEIAKQRLRANAQNPSFSETPNRVFSREQIGKMSGAEFAKFEKAIMEQLRKGLIK